MKNVFMTIFKGLWIGGTLTVPGVSGGSMAMILGIYDRLLSSVNSLLKKGADKKKVIMFLLWTALGGGIGFVVFSRLVSFLLESAPLYVCFFFVGAVIGGVPMVLKSAEIKKVRFLDVVMVALGALIVWLISLIPSGVFSIDGIGGLGGVALKVLCGLILAFGLVLPGISFSQMLYVFGIYGEIVEKVAAFDILPLVPIGIGGVIGIFASSWIVEFLMRKFRRSVYAVIFGFLLGSAPTMFKGQSFVGSAWWAYPVFAVLAALGFVAVYAMSVAEERKTK